MNIEFAQSLVEKLSDIGYYAEIHKDYSGRGMYGKTCVGIVADPGLGMIIGYCAALVVADQSDDIVDLFSFDVRRELPTRSDSMGHQTIYY